MQWKLVNKTHMEPKPYRYKRPTPKQHKKHLKTRHTRLNAIELSLYHELMSSIRMIHTI